MMSLTKNTENEMYTRRSIILISRPNSQVIEKYELRKYHLKDDNMSVEGGGKEIIGKLTDPGL